MTFPARLDSPECLAHPLRCWRLAVSVSYAEGAQIGRKRGPGQAFQVHQDDECIRILRKEARQRRVPSPTAAMALSTALDGQSGQIGDRRAILDHGMLIRQNILAVQVCPGFVPLCLKIVLDLSEYCPGYISGSTWKVREARYRKSGCRLRLHPEMLSPGLRPDPHPTEGGLTSGKPLQNGTFESQMRVPPGRARRLRRHAASKEDRPFLRARSWPKSATSRTRKGQNKVEREDREKGAARQERRPTTGLGGGRARQRPRLARTTSVSCSIHQAFKAARVNNQPP